MNKKQGKPLKMRLFFFLVTHIDGNPAEPDIHDIGILASADPVALDQACVDLIYQAEGKEALVARMEGRNAEHVLEHGESIGLGSRTYQLVSIDE